MRAKGGGKSRTSVSRTLTTATAAIESAWDPWHCTQETARSPWQIPVKGK